MMDIINHIGKVSGIDDAVYASTDIGTARKIISLARYLLATNGQSLPGIQTWQFNHPLPYEDGISEDVYHNLFVQIGLDESLQQSFFQRRCASLSAEDALAYDSTTISVYSENQNDARYGFNKAHDGLKTIKMLTLYSIDSRQPIAFTKQPGNLPDVISLTNALKQLDALGVNTTEIITDNGYYSEQNFSELLQAGFDFITLAKTSIKWIRPEIDKQMEALDDFAACVRLIIPRTVLLSASCMISRRPASMPTIKAVPRKAQWRLSHAGYTCTYTSICPDRMKIKKHFRMTFLN